MGSSTVKLSVIFCLTVFSNLCFAKDNPGYIGRKMAVGYSSQLSFFNTANELLYPSTDLFLQSVINHDIYCELAKGKFKSIAFHMSFQKVPMNFSSDSYYSTYQDVYQNVQVGSSSKNLYFQKVGGTSDFSMLGLGFRYTKYNRKKTIASPIGSGAYFRFDLYLNKPLNNFYKYESTSDLSNSDLEIANKNFKRKYYDKRSATISLGIGKEYKVTLNERMYLRLNAECNLNLAIIKDFYFNEPEYETLSVEDEMQITSKHIINFRNFFLFGIGIGTLI